MIIGITGGTGCGKTTALQVIRELGGMVLDCDAIYHTLLKTDKSLLQAIAAEFPGTVDCGVLNRKKLGAQVFSNPAALQRLNAITHTAVKQAVEEALSQRPPLAAIDAIALFESGLSELCQLTIGVTAPLENRIARLVKRDRISQDYARARIEAQQPESFFREHCDYVLENKGTQEEFRKKCLAFFNELDIIKP